MRRRPVGRRRGGGAALEREQVVQQLRQVARLEARRVHHVVERVGHLARGREAIVAVARQRLQHDVVELGRAHRVLERRRWHLAPAHALDGLDVVGALEQAAAGQHLVKHDAARKDVDAAVDVVATLGLLGRHVGVLALHGAALGRLGRLAQRLGDAEVEQLHAALVRQHDVRRRDVAVDHAQRVAAVVGQAVRVRERATGLAPDVSDQLGPRRAHGLPDRAHGVGQVAAADVLHRDEVLALDVAELEDLHDVRVVEARRQLRLLDEHADERRLLG